MKRKQLLQFWLRHVLLSSRQRNGGFTLVELLIVAIVGSLIITGLMTLVVQLMTTDRAEEIRMETNREMQLALDYMSTELREAVYVYTGDCLANAGDCTGGGANSRAIGNPNTGILPAGIRGPNDVPVLVFWKQEPFPDALRTACANAPANNPLQIGGQAVACTAGSSYALVVYSLSTDNPNNTWEGGARIKRYILEEYRDDGGFQLTPGYINPSRQNNNFSDWPYGGTAVGGNAATPVLVDYVDGTGGQEASCPPGYDMTPDDVALGAAGGVPGNLRSFYACVSRPREGQYQEVLVFLQGNVEGRGNGGVNPQDGRLSTLQTRVFTRGVINAR